MFADPVSNVMLIILLFFAGLVVMFVFILRSLELALQNQEETRRQLSISLSDLERKVAELTFAMREKGLIELEYAPDHECQSPEQPAPPVRRQGLDDLGSLFDKFSGRGAASPDRDKRD